MSGRQSRERRQEAVNVEEMDAFSKDHLTSRTRTQVMDHSYRPPDRGHPWLAGTWDVSVNDVCGWYQPDKRAKGWRW